MTPPNRDHGPSGEGSDRRRSERFDTRLPAVVKITDDDRELSSWVTEIGANGMRLLTEVELAVDAAIQVSFREASNNTRCEARVVWCKPAKNAPGFESGIDITRWGGDLPTEEFFRRSPNLRLKPDRRRPR